MDGTCKEPIKRSLFEETGPSQQSTESTKKSRNLNLLDNSQIEISSRLTSSQPEMDFKPSHGHILKLAAPKPKFELNEVVQEIKRKNRSKPNLAWINVGGRIFEIEIGLLQKHPESVLGSLAITDFFKNLEEPIFIDRDPQLFALILSYYRSGKIHLPQNCSRIALLEEIDYFKVSVRNFEIVDENEIWMKIAKTVRKNVKNEVLRSILVSLAFERDERLRFFFLMEERTKCKTACLDAARVECPYCKQTVYFHTSDWYCIKKRHPGNWLSEEQKWSCCKSSNIELEGCSYVKHYECLGLDKEF